MSGFQPTPPRIKAAVKAYQTHLPKNGLANVPPRPAVWTAYGHPMHPGDVPSSALQGAHSTLAPTPTAATPAPTGPAGQSLPFDPVYEQTISNNGERLTDTLGSIQNTRNATLTDAGYIENNGTFTLDPNNPFSRAALLQRHYDQSVSGSTNSMAARGQLYSGALQNAQNENRFQFDSGTNQNLSSLQSALQALAGRRAGAIADTADSNTSALGASITNAEARAAAEAPDNAQGIANGIQADAIRNKKPAKKAAKKTTRTAWGRSMHR